MWSSGRQLAPLAPLLFLVFPTGSPATGSIPVGTVLPLRLNSTLSSETAHRGQVITARIMQNVPLPGGLSIHAGASVLGHVVSVTSASQASPASISVEFDTLVIGGKTVPITTDLRAIASFVAVEQAQIPDTGPDRGTPDAAFTTVQIGGDIVYRGGGHVEGVNGRVGEPVPGGVLSRVFSNPEEGCRGAISTNEVLQALWVFSSTACGAYGLPNLTIRHAGRSDPTGPITFDSTSGQVIIQAGAGLLLRVSASEASGA